MEQCFVMEYLQRHQPKNTEVRLRMLNHLDPYLGSQNPAVVLASSKLFYHIMISSEETRHLSCDFIERLHPLINRLLKGKDNRGIDLSNVIVICSLTYRKFQP